jgi:hypothetical protein
LVIVRPDLNEVRRLIEAGADIHTRGEDGAMTLMLATRWSDLPLVNDLLARGSNIHARDEVGFTPLMYGAASGRADEEAGRESVRRLSEYLSCAVEEGDVELYACWDGDQEKDPVQRATITPADLGGPAFEFKDSQFLIVQKPPV